MPFTPEQLSYGARAAIDYFLRNDPVDSYNVAHPLFNKLVEGKKEYTGALQYVVEQLRFQNDSNFQSYFGDSQVTYNRKRTLNQAKFTWGAFHDGFGLNEDELAQNGIIMTDDRSSTPTEAEKVQLTNLLSENLQALKLGFVENFDYMLHLDGTQSATNIPGLDLLVSTTPAVGIVGGIDASQAANIWWRNFAATGVAVASLIQTMEQAWRACIRVGGQPPDFLLAGETFIDNYRVQAQTAGNGGIARQVILGDGAGVKKGTTLDPGIGNRVSTGLYFKGVEIIWDPNFLPLDTTYAPAVPWVKRCYMLNTSNLKLRPIQGHWMIARRPPRVYDRYVHYTGLTAKAAFTTNKRNAHAVIATV